MPSKQEIEKLVARLHGKGFSPKEIQHRLQVDGHGDHSVDEITEALPKGAKPNKGLFSVDDPEPKAKPKEKAKDSGPLKNGYYLARDTVTVEGVGGKKITIHKGDWFVTNGKVLGRLVDGKKWVDMEIPLNDDAVDKIKPAMTPPYSYESAKRYLRNAPKAPLDRLGIWMHMENLTHDDPSKTWNPKSDYYKPKDEKPKSEPKEDKGKEKPARDKSKFLREVGDKKVPNPNAKNRTKYPEIKVRSLPWEEQKKYYDEWKGKREASVLRVAARFAAKL
jgi:hypothetical protein